MCNRTCISLIHIYYSATCTERNLSSEQHFSVDITDHPEDPTKYNEQVNNGVTPISKEDISKLFAGRNLVYVSTLSADGSPHITPVWADYFSFSSAFS